MHCNKIHVNFQVCVLWQTLVLRQMAIRCQRGKQFIFFANCTAAHIKYTSSSRNEYYFLFQEEELENLLVRDTTLYDALYASSSRSDFLRLVIKPWLVITPDPMVTFSQFTLKNTTPERHKVSTVAWHCGISAILKDAAHNLKLCGVPAKLHPQPQRILPGMP